MPNTNIFSRSSDVNPDLWFSTPSQQVSNNCIVLGNCGEVYEDLDEAETMGDLASWAETLVEEAVEGEPEEVISEPRIQTNEVETPVRSYEPGLLAGRTIKGVSFPGMDTIEPRLPVSQRNLYNPQLTNTEGTLVLRQYTTDATSTGVEFRFQYWPAGVSFQRSSTLQADNSWGTNIQSAHFSFSTGQKREFSGIIMEGVTIGAHIEGAVRALEMLMSVNYNAEEPLTAPYCYKLIFGDRTETDPIWNKHRAYVITSLSVKEQFYDSEGNRTLVEVDLSLQEVPYYQVNDGRKLMMLFEQDQELEEENCESIKRAADTAYRSMQEFNQRYEEPIEDWNDYVTSSGEERAFEYKYGELQDDCESLNSNYKKWLEARNALEDAECEETLEGDGQELYEQIWNEDGFFSNALGLSFFDNLTDRDNLIRRAVPLAGIWSTLHPDADIPVEISPRNQEALGRCVPLNYHNNQGYANAEEQYNLTQDEFLTGNCGVPLGLRRNRLDNQIIVDGGVVAEKASDSEYCSNFLVEDTIDYLSSMEDLDPDVREALILSNRTQHRETMDLMQNRIEELEELEDFSALSNEQCSKRSDCREYRTLNEGLAEMAVITGEEDYWSEISGVEEEE